MSISHCFVLFLFHFTLVVYGFFGCLLLISFKQNLYVLGFDCMF